MPDWLNHMWMGTYYRMGTHIEKEGGQFLLLTAFAKLVFIAPMHGNQNKVGLRRFCLLYVFSDLGRINTIDYGRRTIFDPIGSIGIIQQGDSYSFFFNY